MDKEKINQAMVSNRVFVLGKDIGEQVINELKSLMFYSVLEDSKKDIFLLIDSNGGQIRYALSFYDFLRTLTCKVTGIITGKCFSAANIIFAGCQERLALPHSRFLFHRIRSEFDLNDIHDVEKAVVLGKKQYQEILSKVYTIYEKEFGLSQEKIKQISTEGELYDYQPFAPEALSLGLIHKIIEKMPFDLSPVV